MTALMNLLCLLCHCLVRTSRLDNDHCAGCAQVPQLTTPDAVQDPKDVKLEDISYEETKMGRIKAYHILPSTL